MAAVRQLRRKTFGRVSESESASKQQHPAFTLRVSFGFLHKLHIELPHHARMQVNIRNPHEMHHNDGTVLYFHSLITKITQGRPNLTGLAPACDNED